MRREGVMISGISIKAAVGVLALLCSVCAFADGSPLGSGGILTFDGEYAVHTFTNDGTFAFAGGEVDILLVGGGGGAMAAGY